MQAYRSEDTAIKIRRTSSSWFVCFYLNDVYSSSGYRCYGQSVRAVIK
ncbi:MAG: hypothetical protein II734_00540 [Paludibacteraceae bacterium]|nr:hypothetical protein [Paludibacteraceae bacterium]